MAVATVSSKGQVTLPKEIRDILHLNEGDRVEFIVQPDGVIELLARTRDLMSLQGMLACPALAEAQGALDGDIGQAVSEEFDRSVR